MKTFLFWLLKFFPQKKKGMLHLDISITKEQYNMIKTGTFISVAICLMVDNKDVSVVVGDMFPTNLTHQKLLFKQLK